MKKCSGPALGRGQGGSPAGQELGRRSCRHANEGERPALRCGGDGGQILCGLCRVGGGRGLCVGRGLPQEGDPRGIPFLTSVPFPPSSSPSGRQPSPGKRRLSLPSAPPPLPPACVVISLPLAVVTQADRAPRSSGSTHPRSWPLSSSQDSSQHSPRHVLFFSGSTVPFLCHGGVQGETQKLSLHLPPQDRNPTSMSARIWQPQSSRCHDRLAVAPSVALQACGSS